MSNILRPFAAPPVQLVQLTVLWNPATDDVEVNGPLAKEIVCLGILEKAKAVVRRYNDDLRQGAVQQAPSGLNL